MLYLIFYFTGFFSIIIFSLLKESKYLYKTLILIIISLILIMTISIDIGGDLLHYERDFYALTANNFALSEWLNNWIQLLIKIFFNEYSLEGMPYKRVNIDDLGNKIINPYYLRDAEIYNQTPHYGFRFYHIITNLVFISGIFALINTVSNNHLRHYPKVLVLILPVTMTYMVSSIEHSLSLGLVFFAASIIPKNKFYFLIIVILSGFLHWSSWIFLPIIFYDRKFFIYSLILLLFIVMSLAIIGISTVNTLITILNAFGIEALETILININDALRSQNDRGISSHHIYLNTLLVFPALLFHTIFGNSFNSKQMKDSYLLISILLLLLICSFIFKDVDHFLVRLGSIIKIISLIYFVNVVNLFNKLRRLIYILLGLNLSLLGIYSFY